MVSGSQKGSRFNTNSVIDWRQLPLSSRYLQVVFSLVRAGAVAASDGIYSSLQQVINSRNHPMTPHDVLHFAGHIGTFIIVHLLQVLLSEAAILLSQTCL